MLNSLLILVLDIYLNDLIIKSKVIIQLNLLNFVLKEINNSKYKNLFICWIDKNYCSYLFIKCLILSDFSAWKLGCLLIFFFFFFFFFFCKPSMLPYSGWHKVKLANVVEDDPMTPYLIASTPRCRGGPLHPQYVLYNAEC